MKTFRIKTSDFINLKKVENITDKNTLAQVEQVEQLTSDKIIKNMNKGKNSVLMIAKSGKYYITARPCYVDSLIAILESAGIASENIVQLKKSSAPVEVSIEQLKNMLIA